MLLLLLVLVILVALWNLVAGIILTALLITVGVWAALAEQQTPYEQRRRRLRQRNGLK